MKKLTAWLCLFIVPAMLFPAGCESEVPKNYPAIELPLAGNMNTASVVDDVMDVPPSRLWHITVDVGPAMEDVMLAGWCVASGGARNDVKVLFLSDVDFENWKNFNQVDGLYQSEKTSVADFKVEDIAPGRYHLVISNWFSEFSSKKVIAKAYLYWKVKPVSFYIADGLELPQGANVTLVFPDDNDASSFNIAFENRKPVSTNITDSKVTFASTLIGTYNFTYGDKANPEKGTLEVVSPAVIGRGLLLSSSMENSPPRLEDIGNITTDDFTVKATDPDDDELYYYAFNLPMAITSQDNRGLNRIWGPAATLDEKSGEFTWGPSSVNMSVGNYMVRFEVSDGSLSNSQYVPINISTEDIARLKSRFNR